jgi:hypothetical protein
MQRNADIGLFTKPSMFADKNNYEYNWFKKQMTNGKQPISTGQLNAGTLSGNSQQHPGVDPRTPDRA